jgi:dipeptidyl aminopeptidase/acylaminoacyl peptidase
MAAAGPAAAAPAIEEYGKLPAVEQMQLSPSGEDLAYVAVDGDARKLVVQQTGGAPLVAVGLGKLKMRYARWLDDDHVLVAISAAVSVDPAAPAPKAEIQESSVLNIRTGKLLSVFDNQSGKIIPMTLGWYGAAHIGGRAFGYFGGQTLTGSGNSMRDFDRGAGYITKGFIDLYKVDLDSGHPDLLVGGTAVAGTDWVVADNGVVVAQSQYDPRTGDWRLYSDPGSGDPIERLNDPVGDIELLGQGRTSGTILVQQSGDTGDWEQVEYSRRGGRGVAPFGGQSMRRLLWDENTKLLIGGVTEGDDPRTVLFDPALQAKFDKVKRAFPGETAELESASSNLDRMVVLTTGPGDSGTFFLIDIPAGKAQAIGWEYPKILQADVAATRIVPYKAADGLAMEGVLTLPPGKPEKNLPLVVLPHGGPEARDHLGFDWWAQAYASRGYAVFQPNFRGSDGFGKAFRDAGYGQWGRKMQTDISDGVAELARQGIVAPKRACIVGASYGGYAALAGVTVQQGRYRCAVSVGGVADLAAMSTWRREKYGEVSPVARSDRLFMGGGSLSDISPARLAKNADAPVLLIVGKDDTVVPVTQSFAMRDALQSAKKDVDLIVLPGEDHWLSREATRTQMLTASVAFVEKYNPPN